MAPQPPGRWRRGGYYVIATYNFLITHDCQSIVGFLLNYQTKSDNLSIMSMKIIKKRIKPWWEPESRFKINPITALPFRAIQDSELERLKDRLLKARLDETANPGLYAPLRRAANEAASLAWATRYPLLVFPELFEEKVHQARRQYVKQERIRGRSARSARLAA
jgi:hypothetical protein